MQRFFPRSRANVIVPADSFVLSLCVVEVGVGGVECDGCGFQGLRGFGHGVRCVGAWVVSLVVDALGGVGSPASKLP